MATGPLIPLQRSSSEGLQVPRAPHVFCLGVVSGQENVSVYIYGADWECLIINGRQNIHQPQWGRSWHKNTPAYFTLQWNNLEDFIHHFSEKFRCDWAPVLHSSKPLLHTCLIAVFPVSLSCSLIMLPRIILLINFLQSNPCLSVCHWPNPN